MPNVRAQNVPVSSVPAQNARVSSVPAPSDRALNGLVPSARGFNVLVPSVLGLNVRALSVRAWNGSAASGGMSSVAANVRNACSGVADRGRREAVANTAVSAKPHIVQPMKKPADRRAFLSGVAEHAFEDRIDVLEVVPEIEQIFEFLGR